METFRELPQGAPQHLKHLVARLRECGQERAADLYWYLRETFEFLELFFASAAIAILAPDMEPGDGLAEGFCKPPRECTWAGKLVAALQRLRSLEAPPPVAEDLLQVFSTGPGLHVQWLEPDGAGKSRFESWRDGLFAGGPPAPGMVAEAAHEMCSILGGWLECASNFFSRWAEGLEPGSLPGHLQVVLTREGDHLSLSPFLEVHDCQDCGALGQLFAYAGRSERGLAVYRNLRLGHLCQEVPQSPLGAWLQAPDGDIPNVDLRPALQPFSLDTLRLPPEAFLAPLRRQLMEEPQGYLLLEGAAGAGKTYLCRFLQRDAQVLPRVRVLYYSLGRDFELNSTWLLRLDESLRRDTPAPVRFPAREVLPAIVRDQPRSDKWLEEYLLTLGRLNAAPVTLILDGLGEQDEHAELVHLLPQDLPDSICILLACEPGDLNRMGPGFSELAAQVRLRVRLDVDTAPYKELVGRFARGEIREDQRKDLSIYSARLLASCPVPPPPEPDSHVVQDFLGGLRSALGSELTRRYTDILQLMAAAGDPVSASWLADVVGSRWETEAFVTRCACLLRQHTEAEPALGLAHPTVSRFLWSAYAEQCRRQARRLAYGAVQEVLSEDGGRGPDPARRLVFSWLLASQDQDLMANFLRQTGAGTALARQIRQMGDPASETEVARAWGRVLDQVSERLGERFEVQLGVACSLRGQLFERAGDHHAARAEYDTATECLRRCLKKEDHPETRLELAQACVRRAGIEKSEARGAIDDCCFALELLTGLEDVDALRAQACRTLGRLSGTSSRLEQAADLYCRAGCVLDLAATCRDLGDLSADRSLLPEALQWYSKSAESLEAAGVAGCAPDLARTLMARGLIRAEADELNEAVADVARAVEGLERLVDQNLRLDLRGDLALSSYQLGTLQSDAGDDRGAERHQSRAVELLDALVGEGRSDFRANLAQALAERGLVRRRLDIPDAVSDYDKSVRLLTELVEVDRRLNLRGELARAFNNRGAARARLGDSEAGQFDFDQAVGHFSNVVERQGLKDLRHSLALAHYNRGDLARKRSLPSAIAELDTAVDQLEPFQADEPRPEVSFHLACALLSRGSARNALGRTEEAVRDHTSAVELLSDLQSSGWLGEPHQLAIALNNRATILAVRGEPRKALADYDQALMLCREDSGHGLARIRLNRGKTLMQCELWEEAARELEGCLDNGSDLEPYERAGGLVLWAEASRKLGDLQRSLQLYQSSIEGYRNGSCPLNLARACEGLSRVRHELGDLTGALEDLHGALALYREMDPSETLGAAMAVAHNRASRLLLDQGQFEQALHEANLALQLCGPSSEAARAEAHLWRAQAQERAGRSEEARRDYDEAVTAYSALVEDLGQFSLHEPLTEAYLGRARLSDPAEAVRDTSWAIDILQDLVEFRGRNDLVIRLARGHLHRGDRLRILGQSREAERDLKKGVDLLTSLPGKLPDSDLVGFCQACVNLGAIRATLGNQTRARDFYAMAIRTLSDHPGVATDLLVEALRACARVCEQLGDFARALEERERASRLLQTEGVDQATAPQALAEEFWRQGELSARLGNAEKAMASFQAGIDLCDRIPDTASRERLLALSWARMGGVLSESGATERALNAFSRALEAFEALPDRENVEIIDEIASTYNNRGQTYSVQAEFKRASADLSRAVEIRSSLADREPAYLRSLALTLNNLGSARADAGELTLALGDYTRVVEILTAQDPQQQGIKNELALAHNNRGQTLADLERHQEALQEFTAAIGLYTAIVEEQGFGEFRDVLATAFFNRACALEPCGQVEAALEDLRQCISIYRVLVSRDRQLENREMLALAYATRAGFLDGLGRQAQALEDYERAAGIYTVLVEAEGRSDLAESLAACNTALHAGLT